VAPRSASEGEEYMKLDFRQRLLTTTLLVGASMVATPVYAQDAQNPPPNPPDNSAIPTTPVTTAPQEGAGVSSTNAQGAPVTAPQEIIVTGSRIPQPNLQTASPVTTVTSQEVKLSGTSRTEDLINALPQVFSDQGSNVSNGATGTAEVNLRGLGTKRTMVLINGKRMVGGDPRDPSADINFIPIQLVKRVDVLTGGASAVYGADAVAGVINFIMDDTFTGFRLDGQASVFNHHNHMGDALVRANTTTQTDVFGVPAYRYPRGMVTNGGSQDIAAVFGAAFDDGRGHVQAYATYRTQDPVLESTRDYSFCALGSFAPQYVAAYGEFYCGGSSTSDTGTFNQFNPTTGAAVGKFHVAGNQFVPGATSFNFAPYNYFQRPDERYTLGAFADYEISPAFHPYLEAMFMHDRTDALIAPSGDFSNTSFINCDNPLMSDQQRATICGDPSLLTTQNGVTGAVVTIGRRNVEGGGRDEVYNHEDYRIVGGMRGDVAKGLSYDVSYQYSTSNLDHAHYNDFSLQRLTKSLDVISVANGAIVPPGTAGATIECRSVFDGSDTNCRPYNVFQTGGVTQDALNYLQVPGFEQGYVAQTIAEADLTFTGADYGLQTPWADTGVGANIGVDYVKNSLSFSPDIEFQTGDLTGNGSTTPPVKGHTDTRELYGEVQVPIIAHNFIDLLQLDAGYRLSNYHISGNSFNTNTYKLEAEFAPIADIRFRASYNRAVRAPNVNELFSPTSIGLVGNSDPCEGLNPTASVDACVATGITAAQYGHIPANPAKQYTGFLGGNPTLKPEKADTWTAGVVVQPRFIPGLAITADYYNIKVKGLIGTLGFSTVLNECLNDSLFCDLIHRDQFGTLWLQPSGFITLTNVNVGGLQTKGIDLQASYNHRLGGLGTMNVSFVGTRLLHLITNPFGDIFYDCAGLYGPTCSTSAESASPDPKWRHKLRVGLTLPNGLGTSVQWRYFSSTQLDTLTNNPTLNGGNGPTGAAGNNHMDARSYFDLAFTARMAQKLNLRLGVNNIFDKDPPVQGLALGNGNTFPQMYDSMGRYMFAGFTVDF
jgi:iron complex outermembrane receptor protein